MYSRHVGEKLAAFTHAYLLLEPTEDQRLSLSMSGFRKPIRCRQIGHAKPGMPQLPMHLHSVFVALKPDQQEAFLSSYAIAASGYLTIFFDTKEQVALWLIGVVTDLAD